jgi:hypothetical protein
VKRPKQKLKLGKKTTIVLPRERKGVDAADEHTLFLYGPPGIGKTTFAAQADALVIATEAGQKFVDVYHEPCPDWKTFIAIVEALAQMKKDEGELAYPAVAIDTVDNLFNQCQAYVCNKLGIDHPSDEEWGKGYQAVKHEFNSQVVKLALLGKQLITISHEKTVEVKGRIIKTQRIVPSLPNSARAVLIPMVDFIGHCGFKMDRTGEATDERVITFEPSETVEAKDRSGLFPRRIPLNYAEFRSYLTGEKAKPAGAAGKPKPKLKRRRR